MKNISLIALILLVVLGLSSAYTVGEGEQVIITEFGKPIGEPVDRAGLHFKVPFIQEVRSFEKRSLEWDGDPNQVPTADKKFIEIDTTARWRITDPLLFLRTVQDQQRAQARLDDVLDAETRDAISSHKLLEAVRSTNREMMHDADDQDEGVTRTTEEISVGRRALAQIVFNGAAPQVEEYGITLIDFRVKHIIYVEDVRAKVYDRMISERRKIAERYRSEGNGKSSEIDGQREKELLRIESGAYKRAQEIRGEAEAIATKIYAEAYGSDAAFYAFLESLSAYEDVLDEKTLLMLSTDSALLRHLTSPE